MKIIERQCKVVEETSRFYPESRLVFFGKWKTKWRRWFAERYIHVGAKIFKAVYFDSSKKAMDFITQVGFIDDWLRELSFHVILGGIWVVIIIYSFITQ